MSLIAQAVGGNEDLDRIADSLADVQVTWVTGLSAVAIFILGIIAARLAQRAVRELGERTDIASPGPFVLAGRIVFYGVVFLAVGAAMGVLGFEIIPIISALGIIAIILALGLQPLIQNFTAGVTLQTRRPFVPGDQVSLLGIEGTVLDVNARAVLVESVDNEHVYLPNSTVLDNPIVNYTAKEARRTALDVGLDYSTDLVMAGQVLRRAAAETEGVVDEPPVEVFIHEFGDSTINASVWFWHAPTIPEAWAVRSRVAINIKRQLDAAGITIAFPQRVLWWGADDKDA